MTMPSNLAHQPVPPLRVRTAESGDIDALMDLEHRVFTTDRLSRRSLRRLLKSPSAEVLVAEEEDGHRAGYYENGGDALRFEKRLVPDPKALAAPPPYFHQTAEFTCGPACIMMALAWADRSFQPEPAFEFRLWRESTTIFMSSGPGGC